MQSLDNAQRIGPVSDEELAHAVVIGDTAEVKRIVKAGVDIDKKDVAGRFPLFWAVIKNKLDMIRTLHELGADMDMCIGPRLDSMIHVAASNGYKHVILLLCELGADINVVNRDSSTALHAVAEDAGADTGQLDAIDTLIASGINCNALDSDGKSAFDIAQKWMHTTVARHIKAAMDST